jgi:chitin synthase
MNRGSLYGTPSHQQLGNTTDLSTLSPISNDIIVACIHECFLNNIIYTRVDSHGLVTINPHKYIHSNSDTVLMKYASEVHDTSGEKVQMTPHIFQLANNVYYHMRQMGQDQAIVMTSVLVSYTTIAYISLIFIIQWRNHLWKIGKLSTGHQSYSWTQP